MQKTLEELQENIRLHLASWHTMCDTSAAIANGLAKLAGGGDLNSVTPLMNMVCHGSEISSGCAIWRASRL